VPLLFPGGHLPGPRWRPLAWLAVFATIAYIVTSTATYEITEYGPYLENPIQLQAPLDAVIARLSVISFALTGGCIVVALASVIVRFRRASGAERQQLKWFLAATACVVFAVILLAITLSSWAWALMQTSMALLPIAIGIAVLRYRLYEIDRLISRTIGWAIVTGLLVGTFALLVLGLQAVVEPLTGGNTLAIAGSTLVVAALFNPVRTRVQAVVDRRFDRSRYDGEQLLAAFGERLRDEVDLATISADARSTVDAAVRPTHVGLWLRGGTGETA